MPHEVAKTNTKDITEKILTFCSACSGIDFYDYEKEFASRIIESIVINDSAEITGLFARQSGKTETLADIIMGLLVVLPELANTFPELLGFKEGFLVGLFAPVYEQTSTTFNRIHARIESTHAEKILRDPELNVSWRKRQMTIRLTNGSLVRGLSANKQTKIESKTYHLIVIEEAQDCDSEVVRKSIHPMGAAVAATIVKSGTPNNKRCDFLDSIKRNKKESEQDHFEYDYKRVIADKKKKYKEDRDPFHLKYAKWIEKEKKRLGEGSDEFRMSYCLDWIIERRMFISDEVFEDVLCDKNLDLVLSKDTGVIVAGIDVGKEEAETVVTILEVDVDEPDAQGQMNKRVLNWFVTSADHETQYYEIRQFLENYNIRAMYVDATGKGDPVADRFVAELGEVMDVVPYKFSTSTKSDLYKYLDLEIKGGRLKIPATDKMQRTRLFKNFKKQMLSLEKGFRKSFMVVSKPDEKGYRDDYPDSLALACMATRNEMLVNIETDESGVFGKNRRWGAYW